MFVSAWRSSDLKTQPKLVVLSIDGVPHGLLGKLIEAGYMPNMAKLCEDHGQPRLMRSVLPTISNVAWSCYATGRNPGKHGVYGFIDRRAGTYDLTLPNSANLRGPNIWQILSEEGMKVFGMNVPGTYPPKPVNGILIGGFLSPSPGKAAYPAEVGRQLEASGYRIDSDAMLARRSKEQMLEDLDVTLAKRAEAMFHFLGAEEWNFFHTHIMGSDRINHFLLGHYLQGSGPLADGFGEFYRKVDGVVGRLINQIGPETPLLILSDHGFCPITYEVQLSRYMVDVGWTKLADQVNGPLAFDPAGTKAYTLLPGRIYVNLAGREPAGCVPPEEYQNVRREVAKDLMALRDPNGKAVIKVVLNREEVYWPAGKSGPDPADVEPASLPPYSAAPDLLAIPYDGYDLKLGLTAKDVFANTELEGMHTYHDALMFARNVSMPTEDFEIRQVAGLILDALGVQVPAELDTRATPPPRGLAHAGAEIY